MIVIRRSHYTAPAFPKPKTFMRVVNGRGQLCMRLTFAPSRRSSAGYHSYDLQLWNPNVRGGKKRVTCEILEDRTGKWVMGHKGCPVPPAVHHEISQLIAELDEASAQEGGQEIAAGAAGADPAKQEKREAFALKKEARVSRLESRAAAKRHEAEALHQSTRQMSDVMAGTPILIGHHSEKRHRRDLDRMHKKTGKAIELTREAVQLERRAETSAASTAISGDDPDAIEKLEARAVSIAAGADQMAALNKAMGRKRNKLTPREIAKARVRLEKTDAAPAIIEAMLKPDAMSRYGFPPYAISNRRSEVRRIKKRIEELKKRSFYGGEKKPEETYGDVRLVEEDNRMRILFPGKPPEPIRKLLKSHGFRWSPKAGAWQRMPSSGAWYHARAIARKWLELDLQKVPTSLKGPGDKMTYDEAHQWLLSRGYKPRPGSSQYIKEGFIGRMESKGNRFTVSEQAVKWTPPLTRSPKIAEPPLPPPFTAAEKQRAIDMGGPKLERIVAKLATQTHKTRSVPVVYEVQKGREIETWPTFNVYRGKDFLGGVQSTGPGQWMTYRDGELSKLHPSREEAIKLLLVSFEIIGAPTDKGFKAKRVQRPKLAAVPKAAATNQWGVLTRMDTNRALRYATKHELFDAWKRQAQKYDLKTARNVGIGAFQIGARKVRLEAVPFEAEQAAIAAAYPPAAPAPKKPAKAKAPAFGTTTQDGKEIGIVQFRTPSGPVYGAAVWGASKRFKTLGGAIRWMDRHGYNPDGTTKSKPTAKAAPKPKPAKKKKADIKWGTTKLNGGVAGISRENVGGELRYMALTLSSSRDFKTLKGAANYLDNRGYFPDGRRKPQKVEDWGVLVDASTGRKVRAARAPEVFAAWARHAEKYDPTAGLNVGLGAFNVEVGYPDAGRRVRLEAVPHDKEQKAIQFAWRRGWIAKKYKEKIAPAAAPKPRPVPKVKAAPAKPKPIAAQQSTTWSQEKARKLGEAYGKRGEGLRMAYETARWTLKRATLDKTDRASIKAGYEAGKPKKKPKAVKLTDFAKQRDGRRLVIGQSTSAVKKAALALAKAEGLPVETIATPSGSAYLLGVPKAVPKPAPKKKTAKRGKSLAEQERESVDKSWRLMKRRDAAWERHGRGERGATREKAQKLDAQVERANELAADIRRRIDAETPAPAATPAPAPPAPPALALVTPPPARGTKRRRGAQTEMFAKQLELFG